MSIKNISLLPHILMLLMVLFDGCSRPKIKFKSHTSSSCDREVAPYSLDALDKAYSCGEKKEQNL